MDESGYSSVSNRGALDSNSAIGFNSVVKTIRTEASDADKKKARETAEDFEAVFLRILFNSMRDATMKGGLFGDNLASDVYNDMFYSEVADLMAHSKPGLGLADVIYQDIIRLGKFDVTAPEDDTNAALTSLELSSATILQKSEVAR